MSTGHDDLEAWKRRRIVELAFELADSGRHENFADIAYALQFERGMTDVQTLIDDGEMRRVLNQRCADARDTLAPVIEPEVIEETVSNDHAVILEPAHLESAPSLLRRALQFWRSGNTSNTGNLNSAAS